MQLVSSYEVTRPSNFSSTYTPIKISNDGKLVLLTERYGFASRSRNIQVWDTQKNMIVQTFAGHPHPSEDFHFAINTADFSPDGRSVVSGSGGETLKIWSLETGQLLKTLGGQPRAEANFMVLSPDQKLLASGKIYGYTITLRDAATGEPKLTLQEEKDIYWKHAFTSVAFSPDGELLAAGLQYGTFRLWE